VTEWKEDPWLRKLRAVVSLTLLGLVVYAVVIQLDLATLGTIIGAMLVALGFEVSLWRGNRD
jgi:uncharacterized membrane protein